MFRPFFRTRFRFMRKSVFFALPLLLLAGAPLSAGAGGIGVAEQIETALLEEGLDSREARARIFTLDSRGLVTTDRELLPYKRKFAKDPQALEWFKEDRDRELHRVAAGTRATVLIGTSGQPGCFDQALVRQVLEHTDRPVILPLSNPTDKAEAIPADVYRWTDGRALVATGSPFPDVVHGDQRYPVAQCNNVFVFPGVGLGVLASGAREVLPDFFTAAARAVSDFVPKEEWRRGRLLPRLEELREVSLEVAMRVGETAIARGVSRPCAFSSFQHQNDPSRLAELIRRMRWEPVYLPLVAM